MRVITACGLIPGAERQDLRLLARPAAAALGVPPRAARTRPALRARRHPEGADPQRVTRRVSAHAWVVVWPGEAEDATGRDSRADVVRRERTARPGLVVVPGSSGPAAAARRGPRRDWVWGMPSGHLRDLIAGARGARGLATRARMSRLAATP